LNEEVAEIAKVMAILDDPVVRAAFKQAWEDSKPSLSGGHEEGGFIVIDSIGSLNVERRQHGQQNTITVPFRYKEHFQYTITVPFRYKEHFQSKSSDDRLPCDSS
jgi:hypothetical protein